MADPNKLRELYQKKYGAPAPKAPAAPKPTTTSTAFPRTLPLTEEEKRKAEQLTGELAVNVEVPKQKMERELLKTEIKADIAKNQPGLSNEEYERLAEESASMFGQPAVGGGFEGPTRPYAFVTPSATPVNVPMTAQRELGLFDVLGPQTKVPQQEAVQYIQPFDDVKFERSLEKVPKEEVAKQRVEYKATKAAFEKLKQQRPELNNFQLIQELDKELNKIPKIITLGPEAPVMSFAQAVQPRKTGVSVPVFSDVQVAYLDSKKDIIDPIEEKKLRDKLSNELVTETTFVRGAPVAKTRKLTELEIENRIKEEKSSLVPWYQDPQKLKEYAEKGVPVKSYGVFGETVYETGATTEGILSYPIRVITSPLNAIAGFFGYSYTPADIQARKEAGREEKFKGTGLYSNILANVGTGGGYGSEIGEVFKYSETPWMKENPWIGYAAGTLLDVAGVADVGVIKGISGFSKALGTGAAASLATRNALSAGDLYRFAAGKGLSSALSELPLVGEKLSKTFEPGSMQLVFGKQLADDLASAAMYKEKFDSIKNMLTAAKESGFEETFLESMGKEFFKKNPNASYDEYIAWAPHEFAVGYTQRKIGNTQFVEDAKKIGSSIYDQLKPGEKNFRYFGMDDYFDEYNKISNAVDKAVWGGKLDPSEERLLRPYVTFAMKVDPSNAKAIREALTTTIKVGEKEIPAGAKVLPSSLMKLGKVADSVKAAAAFDAGVKSIDEILSKSMYGEGNFVMVTPKTIAGPEAKDQLIKDYQKSDLFKFAVSKFKDIETQTAANGEIQSGFKLISPSAAKQKEFDDAKQVIQDSLTRAFANGDVTSQEARSIMSNLNNNFISQSDLKKLTYSEVDNIARISKQGITASSVSADTLLRPSEKQVPSTAMRKKIAQETRFQELTQETPVFVSRSLNYIIGSVDILKTSLSPRQIQVIEQAKMVVNSLNKEFKLEYQKILNDPNVARSYGISPDEGKAKIFMALGVGQNATPEMLKTWTREFIDSLVYSTNNSALYNAFFPGYRYGISILNDSSPIKRALNSIDYSSLDSVWNEIPKLFETVKLAVDKDINVKIAAMNGKVMAVPDALKEESLIVTYIRNKTRQITTKALVDAFETKTARLPGVWEVIFKTVIPDENVAKKIYYALVKQEIVTPGYLDTTFPSKLKRQLNGFLVDIVEDQDARNKISNLVVDEITLGDGELITSLNETIDMIGDSGLSSSNRMEEMIQGLNMLITGKIDIDAYVAPTLVARIQKEIGSPEKFQNALKELAQLSDLAATGNKGALRVAKFVRDALDSYNNWYYFAVLSLNPRFHGVNNLTAPLLTYYTTGRIGILSKNAVSNYKEAVNTMLLGSPNANIAMSKKIVVTDALGNQYSRADIYNILQNSGAFKSQLSAEVPVGFIEDMKVVGDRFKIFGTKSGIPQPPQVWSSMLGDPLATYTDNVHRTVMFIDSLQRGETVEQAVEIARKSFFDYGAISETERALTRNFFIFYNFWRQSIGQFVKNFFQDPGRNIKLMRLSMGTTKMMMGDRPYENASDLSFYYPPEFGATRSVLNFQAAKNYKEGKAILTPTMPYSDALNVLTMTLVNPKAMLFGAQKPAGYGRAYEEGVIYSKLGPVAKTIGTLVMTESGMIDQVKLSKDQIPPEHIALWDAVGLGDYAINLFGAEVVDAQPGQNSYNGKIYKVSSENFNAYRTWIAILQQTGGSRPYTDWGRLVGGFPLVYGAEPKLKGAFPETLPEYIGQTTGAITVTGGARPTDIQLKVLEQQTKEMQEQRKKLQESRKIPVPKQKL